MIGTCEIHSTLIPDEGGRSLFRNVAVALYNGTADRQRVFYCDMIKSHTRTISGLTGANTSSFGCRRPNTSRD